MKTLTWSCRICGKIRPDSAVAVHKRDTSAEHNLPVGTMQEHVRHCNDNPDCVEKAKTFRVFQKPS